MKADHNDLPSADEVRGILKDAWPDPPHRVLLCLGPCHGEFYLPLDRGELEVCPNDREHPVAVYGLIGVNP